MRSMSCSVAVAAQSTMVRATLVIGMPSSSPGGQAPPHAVRSDPDRGELLSGQDTGEPGRQRRCTHIPVVSACWCVHRPSVPPR
jgi:hypothetical protein